MRKHNETFRHFQRRQIQVSITSHGSRLRITAPFGYQWVVGPTNTFSSSLSSVFCHVFEFYNVSNFTHNLTLLIVDLYFMHCWSSLRILVYICIETDFWFHRSAAHLDSTVIYDGCDFGDSRIRPDQCASRRPEESTGAHFGSGHSLPHFDTILCSYTILCNFTSFPNRLP